MRALLSAMLPLLLLPGGNPFSEGVRAYQEGRFQDAYDAFTEAERTAGNNASAELLYNRALSALRLPQTRGGELRAAEVSVEKAVARGGLEFAGLRDFLLGNIEFLRCARAEAAARVQNADPTTLTQAILHAGNAVGAWQMAASSRVDWPEARRNVERALRKLEALEQMKAEAEANQPPKRETAPEPPQDEDPMEEVEAEPTPQAAPPELSPEQLDRLLDKLAQVEAEKRALREARQRIRSANVEKDW